MVKGTVHVHICKCEETGELGGKLHFHDENDATLYESEVFPVQDGTCVCYGPVSSCAQLEAQFNVTQPDAAAQPAKKEEPKKEELKKEEPKASPTAAPRPVSPPRR